MPGHVILSHGLNSSPDATKVSALAEVAHALGWTSERPDYADIDRLGRPSDIDSRALRLKARVLAHQRARPETPLVLAGSSMGAFISALVSREVPTLGLFLMVPPVVIEGYPRMLRAADVPTTIIHAWGDELIPAQDVVRWAQRRRDRLLMVDDGHRLERHVAFCAEEFGRFLQGLPESQP